jgi:putative hydroxymethylpyrimidine transport system substrate-binding protein
MDRRHSKLPARLAMLSVLALVAGACSNNSSTSSAAASGGAPAAASLSVELDWVPNPDHVGLYYAQDKGYFTDSNLTVDFRTPSNTADPIKLVALNKVDLAITYEPEMFYGQESGLPAIAVATVVPVPLNSLIMNPSEPITQLSELAGKSVGVTGIPSDDAFFQTMLKTAGLSESDVTKVNVGFNRSSRRAAPSRRSSPRTSSAFRPTRSWSLRPMPTVCSPTRPTPTR